MSLNHCNIPVKNSVIFLNMKSNCYQFLMNSGSISYLSGMIIFY